MNILKIISAAIVLSSIVVSPSHQCIALPILGESVAQSVDEKYTLRLSDADSGDYILTLFHKGKEIAHYPFQGEMSSVLWSPRNKYVAVNNHAGHAAFCLWIISLADGSVLTNKGAVSDPRYNRYIDENSSGSNILSETMSKIKEAYPDVDNDSIDTGNAACVAYRWIDENHILTFSQFFFEKLSAKSNHLIQIYATYKVDKGVTLDGKSVVIKLAQADVTETIPKSVRRTLGL